MEFGAEFQCLINFRNEILSSLNSNNFPQEVRSQTLLNKYTSDNSCESNYNALFDAMDWIANNVLESVAICGSDDIGESDECGSYIYWGGIVSYDLAFIYMEATHPWHYPHRAILYDPIMKIHVSGINSSVLVTQGVQKELSTFFIADRRTKENSLKEMLKRFDRPRLIDVYEKGDRW
ncbi:MAG: hypothetical protein NC548_45620 [Lachnospiraceae bacterium]|nr:hypothetical protein [Lachnospiraceae bacterium]